MILKTKFTKIYISNYMIVIVPLIILSGYFGQYLMAFFAIIVHESAHAAAAYLRGCKINSARILPFGLNISLEENNCSRLDIIIIYSSGPAANVLLSAISILIYSVLPYKWEPLHFFFILNIYLAFFNLMPAVPLDGGRILQMLLSGKIGLILTGKYLRWLAFVLSIIFILFGIYQLINSGVNLTLIFIGLYIMFLFKTEKMEAALMNIKQIIYRRTKLLKKGIYPARDLVVMNHMTLGETIKSMDFDRFHFVYVLNSDLKLIGIFTENDIMENAFKYNGEMTFTELINTNGNDSNYIRNY